MLDKHPGIAALDRAPLGPAERSQLIEQTQWAREFSGKQIDLLAAYMDAYVAPRGTIILREGGYGAHLILLVKGQVAVIKDDNRRNPKVITTLGPGKTFGEMSLLDGGTHSATVAATADSTLLALSQVNLDRLIAKAPRLGVALVMKIARLMSQYLRQTSGKLIDFLGQ